jgi:hypothetical protein
MFASEEHVIMIRDGVGKEQKLEEVNNRTSKE